MTIRNNGESNGSRSERLHREDAQRSEPLRSAKYQVDANGGWRESLTGHQAANGNGSANSDNPDVVGYGVHLGYKIIEEQILKGQKLAEQWHAPGHKEKKEDEWPRVLDRLLNVYRDLGSVYMDATESIIARVANLAMDFDAGKGEERDPAPANGNADIAVTVSSRKKVRIQLDLKPGTVRNLSIPALHGLDAAAAPLTTVYFSPGLARGQPELQVALPDDCAAGNYTGVIVDADTNEPKGTLCLQVLD
jgi:hypothetical protein